MTMRPLVALFLVPPLLLISQSQQSPVIPTPQAERMVPIDAAPEPTDPAERELRATRDRLQNDRLRNSPPRKLVDAPSGAPPALLIVDRIPIPELPVGMCDTILLGTVSKVQPDLSEDGTQIYTEFSVHVETVVKNLNHLQLDLGRVVSAYEIGGALRLPTGRVLRMEIHGLAPLLEVAHRYALFVLYDPRGGWFRLLKPWEFRERIAVPMDPQDDAKAQHGTSQLAGMNEESFIAAVRRAVAEDSRK